MGVGGQSLNLNRFAAMDYKTYLQSKKWRERRQAKLQQAKYRCEKCGEREGLEVHHKTYIRLGNEKSSDLIVLCKTCHWIADNMRKDSNFKLPPAPLDDWEYIKPYEGRPKEQGEPRFKSYVWPIDKRNP